MGSHTHTTTATTTTTHTPTQRRTIDMKLQSARQHDSTANLGGSTSIRLGDGETGRRGDGETGRLGEAELGRQRRVLEVEDPVGVEQCAERRVVLRVIDKLRWGAGEHREARASEPDDAPGVDGRWVVGGRVDGWWWVWWW